MDDDRDRLGLTIADCPRRAGTCRHVEAIALARGGQMERQTKASGATKRGGGKERRRGGGKRHMYYAYKPRVGAWGTVGDVVNGEEAGGKGGEAHLVVRLAWRCISSFWKLDLKNPVNPRERAAVSGKGVEGRLIPTVRERRAEGKTKRTFGEAVGAMLRLWKTRENGGKQEKTKKEKEKETKNMRGEKDGNHSSSPKITH